MIKSDCDAFWIGDICVEGAGSARFFDLSSPNWSPVNWSCANWSSANWSSALCRLKLCKLKEVRSVVGSGDDVWNSLYSGKPGISACWKLFPRVIETWPPHFTFSNLGSLPASHCHGRLEPKIKFTILGQWLLNGTLRAMNFEKTDAKQVVMCFIDSLMVFIDFYCFFNIFRWFLNEFYLFLLIFKWFSLFF